MATTLYDKQGRAIYLRPPPTSIPSDGRPRGSDDPAYGLVVFIATVGVVVLVAAVVAGVTGACG